MPERGDIENRLRSIEVKALPDISNELARLSAIVERELVQLRRDQEKLAQVQGDHHRLFWGDEQDDREERRAGLVEWRRSVEKTHKEIREKVDTAAKTIIGTIVTAVTGALIALFKALWSGGGK